MKHQQIAILAAMLAAFGIAAVAVESGAQSSAGRKPRVAVLDFDYATVQSTSAAMFGNDVDVGKGISNLLVTDLVKSGSYSVIERSALDKVLAEQNFSNSNRADPTTAARIGKILGVDYIILGSITQFGNETNKQNVGGSGGNWHGFGVGGIGHSNSKANVVIDARVINIDTAEILAVAEGKGESSRSGLSLLGGGGNWNGFGNGNVDFGSSNFQNTIIGEATKKAVDQLTAELTTSAATLPVHTMKVDALIASVDGGQIVLNAGGRAGIKQGDQLSVVRVGKEIKDPATGQVIRRLTSNIGVIQCTDVDDVSAVCNSVSGAGFQVGDHAVTPGTSPGAGSPAAPAPTAGLAPSPQRTSYSGPPAPAAPAGLPPSAAPADQGGSGQPDLTVVKSEFIPGDKVVFADDFSDMAGDEAPPHWKVRGGMAELRQGGGIRQLTIHGDDVYLTPNLIEVPSNFTLEGDILFSEHWEYVYWSFADKKGNDVLAIKARRNYTNLMLDVRAKDGPDLETLIDQQFPEDFDQPIKFQVWCQNGRFRIYINDKRLVDANQISLPPMNAPVADVGNANGAAYVGFRNIRIAESTPDFGKVIESSGRFVTHGILFDTDSDRIKPESAAVLQSIARGLQASPDLKVEIDGHTDSTGIAQHNMDLSKRRAEAVKTVLVSQFNIDASRLTTAGFGSSKPAAPNTTPEGKAQNRRVEFVRK
jgi:outer membrane protein OmpA-like peptidoglycan-associated protein/curli biogenesis system outer membrane secretion channel CsgG